MLNGSRFPLRAFTLLGAVLPGMFFAGQIMAQEATTDDDVVYELNPFEVTSNTSGGYGETETLAGTRVRTDLRDMASSISVVNSKFMEDTGVTDAQDLLVYTVNSEVGGVYGNFSGTGGSTTYNENNNLLRPSNNNRVRGLSSVDNTREFFKSEVPWDAYNVDRVEMQRGPNSILFGEGSPAGIINNTLKTAMFSDESEVSARYGSFGSVRATFDFNREVIEDTLAVRVIALYDDTKFQQEPAFDEDKRIFGTLRYHPDIFGKKNHTSIRVSYENGSVEANRPRSLPPIDAITPWFQTGTTNGFANLNKLTLNPNNSWNQYGNNPAYPNSTYPWFREAFLGRMFNSNIGQFFNATNPTATRTMMPNLGTSNGLDSNGNRDGTIGGIEFARLWGIATFNNYARTALPGGQYYANYSLTDPSIFNFYDKLIDGPNKKEWQDFDALNIGVSQTFFDDRIGIDVSHFQQSYEDGQYVFLGGDQYAISVDINTHLMDGSRNPNVGRPYVANSAQYGSNMTNFDRDSTRLTVFADLRSEDVMERSWLTRILGHHRLTGLYSDDNLDTDIRQFSRWASTTAYTDATGGIPDINNGARSYDWVAYLGPSLLSANSAAGANLSNVSARINPVGTQSVKYFDSNWKATNVAYDAPYTYYTYNALGERVTNNGTQADNPANYVGWTTGNFDIIGAEYGALDELTTSHSFVKKGIESKGITLQSFLLDESVVVTYGYREDEVTTNARSEKGDSTTWGIVLHAPEAIMRHLPGDSKFSVFYGEGENFQASEIRGDIFGNQLGNPVGETTDYGFVLSTWQNRLSLKVTWYETSVSNYTLQGDSAGFGNNLYYVWALPYWGATHALAALDGISDPPLRQGDWGWPWNGIAVDSEGNPDKARIAEIVQDYFESFPLDQNFVDEYGLGMNPDAMRSATTAAQMYAAVPAYGVNGQGASSLGLQPAYSGNLKSTGKGPVATVDTTSEGVEVELNARLTDHWDLTFNISKTDATYSAISPTIDQQIAILTKFYDGDAGLIKLWGGDPLRTIWKNNVLAPYSVLKGQIGAQAPEISPWRFNVVTNYYFASGPVEGMNIGMAYRWQDKRILGYQYDATSDTLDIEKPWYGPTEDHIDAWVGYRTMISDGIEWNIQLNMRNLFEDAHLEPAKIQPDGSIALSRIQEGMTWSITNSFKF